MSEANAFRELSQSLDHSAAYTAVYAGISMSTRKYVGRKDFARATVSHHSSMTLRM